MSYHETVTRTISTLAGAGEKPPEERVCITFRLLKRKKKYLDRTWTKKLVYENYWYSCVYMLQKILKLHPLMVLFSHLGEWDLPVVFVKNMLYFFPAQLDYKLRQKLCNVN